MSSIVNVVLPIFALILLGYLCRRTGRLGETAASEINRFVVWLALPSLLFKATATASWEAIWHPGFIVAFTAGCLGVFAVTLLYRMAQRRSLVDASLDALSASYANTGYMGIPLCVLLLGDEALQPTLISCLIVLCILFAITIVCIETGLHAGQSVGHTLLKVGRALACHPLVVSPVLGALWALSALPLYQPLEQLLDMLGAATAPAALVSLGLFLAHSQTGRSDGVWPIVAIKLLVQPLITWFLAFVVFELPPVWAYSALLLSALPTGTGPFMLAELYKREAALVSRVILFSTLASLVTLSACLYLLGL
ncbi:AEC family transporter [Stutzerimonas azotifigens]|uniref:AEC family transporter n=1 Tax=Stutzerimonas azotifigens TaxID=291995 RepID=UPI0004077311|nr:AEC family transporter [Stutzerimonas azotifigens]